MSDPNLVALFTSWLQEESRLGDPWTPSSVVSWLAEQGVDVDVEEARKILVATYRRGNALSKNGPDLWHTNVTIRDLPPAEPQERRPGGGGNR